MPSAVHGMNFAHFKFDPVQDLLGEGPMAEVYRAQDEKLGRTVALKILRPHVDIDPEADQRFEREARHASNLVHNNIATIYEYGEDAGRSYIAMEYIHGRTLDKIIKDSQLGLEEALRIADQLTAALAVVHRAGLIHRDLKPANLMVLEDGSVKLLDFGIARAHGEATITQHGMLVGTVLYMSPEQVRGDELDARADIFSLGAMLYHSIGGTLPFPGNSFPEVCMAILDGTPRPLSEVRSGLPADLDAFVMRCLAPDPEQRYANATEAHGALVAVIDGLSSAHGVQRSAHLTGTLAFAPLSSAPEFNDLAASLRTDISGALKRSGVTIERLQQPELPKDLTADWVLSAQLKMDGPTGSLDLTLHPLHTTNGVADVWHHRIEHSDEDEWALQDDLVRTAVRSLRRQLAEYGTLPSPAATVRDPKQAQALAQRGHVVLHKGLTKHLLASVSIFRRALEEDPRCAVAYAGMAEALSRKFLYWDGDQSFIAEARDNARRALSLDHTCAEAHTSLGFAYHLTGAFIDAQREYRLAIQLENNEWLAHRLLGAMLSREGNFKGASPLLQRAIAIKPNYISTYDHLYHVFQRLDRYQEAIETADRGIAVAKQQLAHVPDDQDARVHLATLLARMGLRDEALAQIETCREFGPKDGFTSLHISIVHAVLGEPEESLAALTTAQSRGYFIRVEDRSPEFDILRGLPEFDELLK